METLPNEPQGLTLQELASETGVEPRTIRSYVEKGVIPGPERLGRGARYSPETLDRLKVLQLLRDANRELSLDQVRVLLHSIGPSQARAIADGTLRIGAVIDTDTRSAGFSRTALDYLQGLKTQSGKAHDDSAVGPMWSAFLHEDLTDAADLTVLEAAARALASLAGQSSASRSTRGENWYRLPLTRDIELSVRGEFGPEQLAQLHRIGDALRTLLTKGPSS
jgi:Ca-activated chloride channel family protein